MRAAIWACGCAALIGACGGRVEEIERAPEQDLDTPRTTPPTMPSEQPELDRPPVVPSTQPASACAPDPSKALHAWSIPESVSDIMRRNPCFALAHDARAWGADELAKVARDDGVTVTDGQYHLFALRASGQTTVVWRGSTTNADAGLAFWPDGSGKMLAVEHPFDGGGYLWLATWEKGYQGTEVRITVEAPSSGWIWILGNDRKAVTPFETDFIGLE